MTSAETELTEQGWKTHIPTSPADIIDILDTLIEQQASRGVRPGGEKSNYHMLTIAVIATPIGEEGEPSDVPFAAISRQISLDGIRLIHTCAPNTKSLIVEFRVSKMERVRVPVEIVRCRPAGKLYEIDARVLWRDAREPSELAESSVAPA